MTVRSATKTMFERYASHCQHDDRLAWMCIQGIQHAEDWPIDKLNRWLGFVQGVLFMQGAILLDRERDVSRPLFHTAYRAEGETPPATASFK